MLYTKSISNQQPIYPIAQNVTRPYQGLKELGGVKGAKGRPTYAIFVVKLSKAYLHGAKAVLMEVIQSVFEHGMLEIRFAQLAVDIIVNTNEIQVNAKIIFRSQLIYSVFSYF